MKKIILIIIVIINFSSCHAQDNDLGIKVDNLKHVETMPYIPELSGDSLFWTVVKEGIDIVPYLIQKLDDTTKTDASVENFGGTYTVADVAYRAVSEIIKDLPTLEFAEDTNNPEPRDGYWGYWNYTRRSFENRIKFKDRVSEWFKTNEANLKWTEYKRKFRSVPDWKLERDKHPLGGYYVLKK